MPDSFGATAGQWVEHALGVAADADAAVRVAAAALSVQALVAQHHPGAALFDVPPSAFDRAIAARLL